MTTQIEFEQHIKSFSGSMCGIQRVLYAGRKIDMKKCPVLAQFPWKRVYTTSDDENLANVFRLDNERQVKTVWTTEEYDKEGDKLDSRNPLLVFLNGDDNQAGEQIDLDKELALEENRNGLRERLGKLLKSELMFELTIVGYAPDDPNEIPLKDLYRLFNSLIDNRLFFYGLSEKEKNDRYIKALVEKGIATVFDQDLGQELEKKQNNVSFFEEVPSDEHTEPADLFNTVYINGTPVQLDKVLCYDFAEYGRVLSVEEMFPGTITRAMQVNFFYQFLKRSPNSPQWYGYAKRNGFAVKREYEDTLYKKVVDGLKNNSDKPIILAGQSGSGKSIALGALAYRIFQEHEYPILYINNPNVSFAVDSPAFIALDNILKEIRDKGGQALVILDWSLYSFRNDIIRSISDKCNNRGHKVLFVASAIKAPKDKNRYNSVIAKIKLTETETKAFKTLLEEKGNLSNTLVENWMKEVTDDPRLLSLLYKLVYDLHPQLELGIKQEINKALADTKEQLDELEPQILRKREQEMTQIAAQLAKFFPDLVSQENGDENASNINQKIIDSLQSFSESLAVASLFRLRMPLTLALRLLNIPECQNQQAYRDIVLDAPWLVYAMDDDRYSQGEYYVKFRAPIDAEIYLKSIKKDDSDKMKIVANIIRSIKDMNAFYQTEVKFMGQLIRMIGPNSDDPSVNDPSDKDKWYFSYGRSCNSIIKALGDLRESGIVEPLLVAQEITYIREYYGNESQQDLSECINWLQKAVTIARSVLNNRPNENFNWNQGLIDSITVESIFAELQLERCYVKADKEFVSYDKTKAILFPYRDRSEKLLEVISNQPENSYAYTALLSCFLAEYQDKPISYETFSSMSDVLEVVDLTADINPAVENNEFYQIKKTDFLKFFDDAYGDGKKAKTFFNELLKKGSPIGVYIKARNIIRNANIKYNTPLNKDAESECEKALELLKRYDKIVCKHAASQYMRIQLTWLYYNKKPLFQQERQRTSLTQEQWEDLYNICQPLNDIINTQQKYSYRATVFYIMALACAQRGHYQKAVDIWRNVQESDFYDIGRQRTWHVLCNEQGQPLKFNGTFNRYGLPEQRIYIADMKLRVFYRSLQSINRSERSGDASNLCIGTSYRGFRAFAMGRETLGD